MCVIVCIKRVHENQRDLAAILVVEVLCASNIVDALRLGNTREVPEQSDKENDEPQSG